MGWRTRLEAEDHRMMDEVRLAEAYAKGFHHGTSGHLGYMTLARVAGMLDYAERQVREKGTMAAGLTPGASREATARWVAQQEALKVQPIVGQRYEEAAQSLADWKATNPSQMSDLEKEWREKGLPTATELPEDSEPSE
jgi:hypothetical protein